MKLGISTVWQLLIHYETLSGVSVMPLCTWKLFSSARDCVGTVTNARKCACDATNERLVSGVVLSAERQMSL